MSLPRTANSRNWLNWVDWNEPVVQQGVGDGLRIESRTAADRPNPAGRPCWSHRSGSPPDLPVAVRTAIVPQCPEHSDQRGTGGIRLALQRFHGRLLGRVGNGR